MKRYMLIIADGIEPLPLRGPYKTEAHRIRAARRRRRRDPEQRDGLYRLDAHPNERAEVWPFAGREVDPD